MHLISIDFFSYRPETKEGSGPGPPTQPIKLILHERCVSVILKLYSVPGYILSYSFVDSFPL